MPSLAKLQWQCRRGTKELDLLLQNYLQTEYLQSTAEEKTLFAELLNLEDDQLYAYFLEKNKSRLEQLMPLINKII
jgi:antitoxin CptB